jgi:isoleucyl-tRNA synthetase
MTEFPRFEKRWVDDQLRARYERLFEIRGAVTKALEDARNAKLIGSGLDARVTVTANDETRSFLEGFGDDLRFVFIVSQVELVDGSTLSVSVARAEGEKCDRCWNFTTDVGLDPNYPGACARCIESLKETLG